MNVFKNIFGRRKKWNKEHIESWKDELKLKGDGYSKFQSDLASKVKSELSDLEIEFSTITTEHESEREDFEPNATICSLSVI